jgi:hypothetical protein
MQFHFNNKKYRGTGGDIRFCRQKQTLIALYSSLIGHLTEKSYLFMSRFETFYLGQDTNTF